MSLSAQQGYAPARFNPGYYMRGQGVRKAFEAAVALFQKAENQGLPDAQVLPGEAQERGNGVKPDRKEVVKWYKKVALQGDKDAIAKLKKMSQDK
ncbi:hypothetical protein NB640_12670 [Oxalobacter vibrioformis]|uniref:Sel1 repeat family protein n=1 Tax=Oxalobacter vibrioformis TaxID=933080 RepID=A0A9E9P3B6_9BURK|nr:hypothetical protein [Oxalobacter vibrioformis]WAW10050.1 hypothetical protein NB640_12670 [Oxalobacter vibrioformis]